MKIIQSPSFNRRVKKFHKSEKEELDTQIRGIASNPSIGQEKKGDLKGIFVYKFKIKTIQCLLAYRTRSDQIELIMIGPHESFYRELKTHMKRRK